MTLIKLKPVILFLSLVIVSFLAILIYFRATPPPPSIPTPEKIKGVFPDAAPLQISFKGNYFEIPARFSYYFISTEVLENFAPIIAQKLLLTPSPEYPTLWVGNGNYSLVLNPYSNTLIYSAPDTTEKTSLPGINSDTAVAAAFQFIQGLEIGKATPNMGNVVYLSNAQEYINPLPSSPETARYLLIPFHYEIENYPLLIDDLPQAKLHIIINQQNQVIKAVFTAPLTTPQKIGESHSISLEDAFNQIRLGNATIIAAKASNFQAVPQLTDIHALEIDGGRIEFRLNTQNHTALPYYYFQGTGYSQNNQFVLELIILAIK